MCGFNFIVGESYIVYAFRTNAGLETNICTRTVKREQSGEEMAELDRVVTQKGKS